MALHLGKKRMFKLVTVDMVFVSMITWAVIQRAAAPHGMSEFFERRSSCY